VDSYKADSDDDLLLSNDNEFEFFNSQLGSHKQLDIRNNATEDSKKLTINKIRDFMKNKVYLNDNAPANSSRNLTHNSFQQNKLQLRSSEEDLNSHNLLDIGYIADLERIKVRDNNLSRLSIFNLKKLLSKASKVYNLIHILLSTNIYRS